MKYLKATLRRIRMHRHKRTIETSGLFDSTWYLAQYTDVKQAQLDPIEHYLVSGWLEGRNPSQEFNTNDYLSANPDVSKKRFNPLLHFIRNGIKEGRALSVKENAPKPFTVNSLSQIAVPINTKKNQPKVLLVSHFLPYPPQAGNGYRVHRMMSWFAEQDYDLYVVVCPHPDETLTMKSIETACSMYPNLIVCNHDGTILYQLADDQSKIKDLIGLLPRSFDNFPGVSEKSDYTPQSEYVILKTFCPDAFMELLLHLSIKLQPSLMMCNYVFMARIFPLLPDSIYKMIDTMDVFSSIPEKVSRFGVENDSVVSKEVEASLLNAADLIIAIQSEEAEKLQFLAPKKNIITVGVDFDLKPVEPFSDSSCNILLIGSKNPRNLKGLVDFLRFAWPIVLKQVPHAQLQIIGSIGEGLQDYDIEQVAILGHVDSLDNAYSEARLVINPAIAGTGLKIKTVEALCHLRPIVAWPSGVEGLEPELRDLCAVAENWYDFALKVIHACQNDKSLEDLELARTIINKRFSKEEVYKPLKMALKEEFVCSP